MEMEGVKIVYYQRGRIKVGRLCKHPTLAFHWWLQGARVIRIWGTTEGIEEIAQDGPVAGKTKLDRPRDTTIPFSSVIEIIDCVEERWLAHLPSLSNSSAEQPNKTRARR